MGGVDAAHRADIVGGKRSAFIYVTADVADIFTVLGRIGDVGRRGFGTLALYNRVIVGIGHGNRVREKISVDYFAQENGMCRSFHGFLHAAEDISAGIGEDGKAAFYSVIDIGEFIYVTAAPKAESADELVGGLLGKDGNGEISIADDAGMGVIVMIHADGNGSGRGRDLHNAVGNAAGRTIAIHGGNNIDTIG